MDGNGYSRTLLHDIYSNHNLRQQSFIAETS